MSEAPTWKKLFDRLDATVGTRLNEFVRSEDLATVVALARRGQREFSNRGEQMTRRVLHSMNLPAGSDVNRLLTQIGNLEREVRALRKRLTDAETPRSSPRPDRSTQRPKGLTRGDTTSRTRSGSRKAAS